MYCLANIMIKLSMFKGAGGFPPPWKFIDVPWRGSPPVKNHSSRAFNYLSELVATSVKIYQNQHYYRIVGKCQ